ncbi:MAG: hypothetical protein ACI9N1_002207 [Flavobacteriales bacterium]|jgi:hypothetical protein
MNKSNPIVSSIKYATLIAIAVLMANCSVIDKPETVPAWIEIDEFDFTTVSSEGTDRHKIKDAWVYVNSNLEGVFELPARIPITENGNTKIDIIPGIYKNGIQSDHDKYPFYTYFSATMDLKADSTYQITSAIEYQDNLNFWIEDFEDPSIDFTPSNDSDTAMFIGKPSQFNDLLEGDAGVIHMSSSNYLCQMNTDEVIFADLPRNLAIPAYLEMDYKCNYPFEIGILSRDDQLANYVRTPLITINAISTWNKTYLYLPDVTNFFPTATEFQIYIRVFNTTGADGIEVMVDNLKVIFA